MRSRMISLAAGAVFAWSAASAAQTPPLTELAGLLEKHDYADVRSLVATNSAFELLVRMKDGRPARAVVDGGFKTVTESEGAVSLVRYGEPAAAQMTFRELMTMLDGTWPNSKLVELKRSQGAYEVHLRTAEDAAIGVLIDFTTRKSMPYHSHD